MTVGFIHSTRLVLAPIEQALAPFAPRARFLHALDEALIVELAKGEGVTRVAMERIAAMARSLAGAGADHLVLSCSSLSPAVDMIAASLPAPLKKIDEAMIVSAVSAMADPAAPAFTILATNPSTRAPMRIIVEAAAARAMEGAQPAAGSRALAEWRYELVEGAFEALNRGETEAHDRAVAESCERLAAQGRRVLLAQISMARILPLLSPAARAEVRTTLDFLESTVFGSLL